MLSKYGQFSDTYTDLTGTGLIAGQVEKVPNSPNEKMLVLNDSTGTIPDGSALKFKSGSASSFIVKANTAATIPVIGVNDNVGTTAIPVSTYFWMTYKGLCKPLCANGTAINDIVGPSAVAGTLGAIGTGMQQNIQAIAANTSGLAAKTYCVMT